MSLQISVLMPAYDEADNLAEVVPETLVELERLGLTHELLVIDDGSQDRTTDVMARLQGEHPRLRYLRLRRNLGKSAALNIGLQRSHGDVVVLMDADGQDDPREIPKLLGALEERGLDLVTGSRVAVRKDRFMKRSTSRFYNRATTLVTGIGGRDFNSGFKAMRREVADALDVHGELHRYIPALAAWAGFRVGEVPVEHHRRRHGTSKFGRARYWRGFLDLITVKFLTTYTRRPFHLFGGLGATIGVVGAGLLTWMLATKVMLGEPIGARPALLLGVLLVVVAVQLMSLGLVGELLIQDKRAATPESFVQERDADRLVDVRSLPPLDPAPLRPPDSVQGRPQPVETGGP